MVDNLMVNCLVYTSDNGYVEYAEYAPSVQLEIGVSGPTIAGILPYGTKFDAFGNTNKLGTTLSDLNLDTPGNWTFTIDNMYSYRFRFKEWQYEIGASETRYTNANETFIYTDDQDIRVWLIITDENGEGGGGGGGDSGDDEDYSEIIKKYCDTGIDFTDAVVSPNRDSYIYLSIDSMLAIKYTFDFCACYVDFIDSYGRRREVPFTWERAGNTYAKLPSTSSWYEISYSDIKENDYCLYVLNPKEFDPQGIEPDEYQVHIVFYDDYGGEYFDKTITIKTSEGIAVWQWNKSNGNATDTKTLSAYTAIITGGEIDDFSYLVWNDMVDKVLEILECLNGEWSGLFLDADNTKMTPNEEGRTLTADRFNALRQNIGSRYATGILDKSPGEDVSGSDFIILADCINAWIYRDCM